MSEFNGFFLFYLIAIRGHELGRLLACRWDSILDGVGRIALSEQPARLGVG